MATSLARLVIAGLSGDSGKTIASLSFITALKRRSRTVSVFKKGPDYIDPAWLAMAAQSPCRNLDTYMVDREDVLKSFVEHSAGGGTAVVEGNRGLFDGKDSAGTHSTAELAKLIDAPVVLVVDAVKTTRTVAAIVKGCVEFDPEVKIAGVILNRIAGNRHAGVITESIETYCALPVLGAVPRLGADTRLIPGRHLGLVTPSEYGNETDLRSTLSDIADRYIDVDRMIAIAEAAGPAPGVQPGPSRAAAPPTRSAVSVGYFSDPVFTFYYPENLEALEKAGATLVPVSSLSDEKLPAVDALYIGGGFPETHAEQLVANRALMKAVKNAATDGLPVYAECGGLIYLARSLRCGDAVYPMTGLFDVDLEMRDKPVGHGYTSVRVDKPNPFYDVGSEIRGHEFHYSGPAGGLDLGSRGVASCMAVETGAGVGGARDGLVWGNTLACYCHVHADGVKQWASSIVANARDYAAGRGRGGAKNGGKAIISVAL
jgi:cobyrinic acid a,c-diamide synthase